MSQRLYAPDDAAIYLGMSRRSFDAIAAPHLPYIALGSRKRFDRDDLDAWARNQRKIAPAGVVRREETTTCTTKTNQRDSSAGAKSGGSTRPSGSATRPSSFGRALDAARSRMRASS
ncbi:MAG: helix-turn-helix domain-containing protein [Sphingobacterium sp.]|nr:helix-turn-helix domain-containing protein [Sphingobacterium sp.]